MMTEGGITMNTPQDEGILGGRISKTITIQAIKRLGPKLLPIVASKLDAKGDLASKMVAEALKTQGSQMTDLLIEALQEVDV